MSSKFINTSTPITPCLMSKSIIEKPIKELIIEILGKEGMSINSLSKKLSEKGVRVHRLFLTGYLTAMKDMGYLKERDIKPAKVFSVTSTEKMDIYKKIGIKSREINEENAADICLYTLYRLFNRPVFMRELNRAGVGAPAHAKKVFGDERKNALEIVINAGIAIPRNNSAYIPDKEYTNEFNQIISELLWESYGTKNLVNRSVQQKKILED